MYEFIDCMKLLTTNESLRWLVTRQAIQSAGKRDVGTPGDVLPPGSPKHLCTEHQAEIKPCDQPESQTGREQSREAPPSLI